MRGRSFRSGLWRRLSSPPWRPLSRHGSNWATLLAMTTRDLHVRSQVAHNRCDLKGPAQAIARTPEAYDSTLLPPDSSRPDVSPEPKPRPHHPHCLRFETMEGGGGRRLRREATPTVIRPKQDAASAPSTFSTNSRRRSGSCATLTKQGF
jgi:hypothetical protein